MREKWCCVMRKKGTRIKWHQNCNIARAYIQWTQNVCMTRKGAEKNECKRYWNDENITSHNKKMILLYLSLFSLHAMIYTVYSYTLMLSHRMDVLLYLKDIFAGFKDHTTNTLSLFLAQWNEYNECNRFTWKKCWWWEKFEIKNSKSE